MTEEGYFYINKIKLFHLLLTLLIIFYLLNGISYLRAQSLTFDESSFLSYAARLVKGHPERIYPVTDNSKMPVCAVNLIPRAVSQLLHPGLKKTDNGASDVFAGRYITLLISVLIILVAYCWSKQLYGPWAGLFSAFLVSFCPNIIANAGLVTTDSYSALFLLLTTYSLWKFCMNASVKYFIIFSLLVAVSQLVKQSLANLYILYPVMLCIYYFVHRPPLSRRIFIKNVILFIFINWLVINLGFYFLGTNTPIGNYHFESNAFLKLQRIFPSWVPLPFPHAFITGLDLSKYYDQIGGGNFTMSSFGKVTILGNSSTGGSFWYYYFVSLFFKTPLSNLIFIFGGLAVISKYRSKKDFFKNEFFLVAPVVYFLFYMSFLYKTQIGVRQIIFIYPLLYILCGSLFHWLKGIYLRSAVLVLSCFLVVSVLRYWRNYYPYTNELIFDKTMAYDYVGSANLEFNQSDLFIAKYLREHPEVKMAGYQPGTGLFLIKLNDYMDVWNLHKYDWIRRFKPIGNVACNPLLIFVNPDDK